MEQQLENAFSFVVSLCKSPACFDHVNERFRACNCICRLSVESRSNLVQNLKARFVSKKENRINQTQKVIAAGEGRRSSRKKCEKTNFSRKQRKLAFYDLLGNDTDLLYKASVKNLLGFGCVAWKALVRGAKGSVGKETQHGDIGQTRANEFSLSDDGSKTPMKFLDCIGDMHGEPHATRMIRESTGMGASVGIVIEK